MLPTPFPTITEILLFFNLFAGLMLTASLILFLGGFAMYLVRLGTYPTYREDALVYMQWGVSVLFALIVLLGVQQFLLSHMIVAMTIGTLLLIALVIWAFTDEPKKEEKKPNGAAPH